MTLVLWRQQSLLDDLQTPFEHNDFDQYPLIAPQPWELAKEVQLALIWSLPCTLMSHRWTVYVTHKSPKEWHKTRFCYFFSKIHLLLKESATKFLCVKTSSGKVVAKSFVYLTVHRWIPGDVPIYLKFALKVTHPRQKTPISTDFTK